MVDYLKERLTKGEWFVYAWQADELGDFHNSLAESIKKADYLNREKLKKGFPEEVKALEAYWCTSGWWRALKIKVLELKREELLKEKLIFTIDHKHAIPLKLSLQKLMKHLGSGSTVQMLETITDQLADYWRLKNER